MKKVQSHRMWCFECQNEFSTQLVLEKAYCVLCKSQIIEKIDDESHIRELKDQEIITRENGKEG